MSPFCLLVVAKAPVPGFAKTRLTPPATPEQAAAVAAASLLDTLAAVADTPGARAVVAMTGVLGDAARAGELRAALSGVAVLPQRGDGFGARLANAHADAARVCPGLPVLQIGMDTPQVSGDLLGRTAALLDGSDAVLGPAEDGGWWALGLRDPGAADVLRTVPLSRPDTGARTLEALSAKGNPVAIGDTLSDVDIWLDACRVAELVPGGRFATAVRAIPAVPAVAGRRA